MAYNVLVVDDSSSFRRAVIKAMKKNGTWDWVYYEAGEGSQALKILSKRKFDLIILDYYMPRMSGYAVCKSIRKNSLFKKIPIIFISSENDMKTQIYLGKISNGFISKALKPEQIAKTILEYR